MKRIRLALHNIIGHPLMELCYIFGLIGAGNYIHNVVFYIEGDSNENSPDLFWEYGTCNNVQARRNKIMGNVQFIIFKKGDQNYIDGIGHTEDKWIDFDKSWWQEFKPNDYGAEAQEEK